MTDGAPAPHPAATPGPRIRARLVLVGLVSLGVLAALALTGSSPGRVGVDPTQGITRRSVSVGAIVTQTGPLAADFAPYLDGVRAYLAEVDAHGGVQGRTVRLVAALDDMSVPTSDLSDARVLVSQDHVFAIVGVASPFFEAASLLAHAGVPTFGYATANVWAGPPNLFAVGGSSIDDASIVPQVAFLARKVGTRRVALLALGVPASQAPCVAMRDGLGADGIRVGYANLDVPVVGSDLATDVVQMQQRHVGLVVSCMDVDTNVLLARAMQLHAMRVSSLWLDGYDRTILHADASVMARVYLVVQHVPFELARAFPGLERYTAAMASDGYRADAASDVALAGWESASLFVAGLRAAGPHPTQQSVVAAVNAIGSDTGGGVAPPVDWRVAHRAIAVPGPSCVAFVTTSGTSGADPRFVPAFGSDRAPWTCLAPGAGPPHVVRPPAGTPLG